MTVGDCSNQNLDEVSSHKWFDEKGEFQQPSSPVKSVHIDYLEEWQQDYLLGLIPLSVYPIGYVVAGGCLRNLGIKDESRREKIRDIDLFLKKEYLTNPSIRRARDILDPSRKDEHLEFLDAYGEGKRVCELLYNGTIVQLVHPRNCASIPKLLNSFDICASQWAFDGEFLHFTEQAKIDCETKKVTLHRYVNFNKIIQRLNKYETMHGYSVKDAINDAHELRTKVGDQLLGDLFYFF